MVNDTYPSTEELQAYIRGELDAVRMVEVKQAIHSSDRVRAEYLLQKQISDNGTSNEIFPGALGWAKLSKSIDEERSDTAFWQRKLSAWQAAAAVAAGIVVWQGLAMPIIDRQTDDGSYRYEFASAETHQYTLRVRFVESATVSDVTGLLTSVHGEVVGGPGALGLYEVSFETADLKETAKQKLESSDQLIESVY